MADANGLFWNSSNGDRTYNADSFSEWLGKFFTTGIFNGELQVTPAGGMNVNVATGYANIQGKVKFFDTATQFTVPTANSTYPRIDTIVVQADYTNRTISMEYVQGSYSGNNPTPQAPVRDTGIYQLVLAQIRVNAGATEVTTANITDTRANADLCGWVTGTVDHVAVSQLTEQAQAEFAIWFDHMKDQLSEDAAGNLQLEVDTLAGSIAYVEHAIADIDHVKGSFVTIGNQMYKVTAAVTAGDTFEIGVNIERISVGEELTSLNKGLTNYLVTETFIQTGVSVPAGTVSDYTFSVGKAGYTPLGIVGIVISSGGSCTLVHAFLTGAQQNIQGKVRLRNNGTAAIAPSDVQIVVLYVKSAI